MIEPLHFLEIFAIITLPKDGLLRFLFEERLDVRQRYFRYILLLVGVCFAAITDTLEGQQMTRGQARDAVAGWLRLGSDWSGFSRVDKIARIEAIGPEEDRVRAYVVHFVPTGYVVVSADIRVEPILGFCREGLYPSTPEDFGEHIICQDLKGRIDYRQSSQLQGFEAGDEAEQEAYDKWIRLFQAAASLEENDDFSALGETTVGDIRVEPMVLSQWGQGSVCGLDCYNLYTPNHYLTGCVATALAQLMYYHQHPTGSIPQVLQYYQVNGGGYQWAYPRGGDGAGGAYPWDNMVLVPACGITDTQREAIGALCYDAALSVNMNFTSSVSLADPLKAKDALTGLFDYDHAVKAFFNGSGGADLNDMINPNLDASCPVIIGIRDDQYNSHAAVVDGYGYDTGTLYHHLNLGWSGAYNLWYNLPNVDSNPAFTVVSQCIYNIFVTGAGEMISGRVTDLSGQPLAGAAVTAEAAGGSLYQTVTNDKGIYALEKVPANTAYHIRASKAGWYFLPQDVTTGQSSDFSVPCGNLWGVDFAAQTPSPPVAYDDHLVIAKDGTPVPITLGAIDEGHPDPPAALRYVIVTLPEYGILTDPGGGQIQDHDLPYTLSGSGNQVDYTFYGSYANSDHFDFQADDHGSAPAGGLSNTATVSIEVAAPVLLSEDFEAGFPTGWTIIDGLSDGYTWSRFDQGDGQGYGMIADSLSANGAMLDEQLITPSINLTSRSNIILSFEHECLYDTEQAIADVDIRINQGSWQNVARYQGDNTSGQVVLDISTWAAGQSDVQLRWHYYNAAWDIHWKIDNVQVSGACDNYYAGDLNDSCGVDWADLALFITYWLDSPCNIMNGWCQNADSDHSGRVEMVDYAVLSRNWLLGKSK